MSNNPMWNTLQVTQTPSFGDHFMVMCFGSAVEMVTFFILYLRFTTSTAPSVFFHHYIHFFKKSCKGLYGILFNFPKLVSFS